MTNKLNSKVSPRDDLMRRRQRVLGPAYRLLYENPVHFVRARGVHLYDPEGVDYLDAYNNVPCIGHSHPAVAAAVSAQLGLINTNTRYLQDGVVEYAEQLLETFPRELGNVMFTCSGSEANDLALRVARFTTGNTGVIITNNAYHGTTQEVAGISPSLGPGVETPPHVRLIPAPDAFATGMNAAELSEWMVARVESAVEDLEASGHGVSALVLDTIFSSDGILPEPVTWIAQAADVVREAGGLFIADEVQAGFGRLGTGMWGFERHRVVPDIVTMGKSMGNGYPVAAAVFQPQLLTAFGPTVRYFNTFGGSSGAVAAASAVLRTIRDEDLITHAERVGEEIRKGMLDLAASDPRVGCVRGSGLALGIAMVCARGGNPPVEGMGLVTGRASGANIPVSDPALASRIVNGMREKRVLISSCGDGSVLKVRPPLAFGEADVSRLLETFEQVLHDTR